MEPSYWVTLENDVAGPYTVDQLAEYLQQGRLNGAHQICEDGTETWFSLSQLLQPPVAPQAQAPAYRPGATPHVAGTVSPLLAPAPAQPSPYHVQSTTSSAQMVVIFIIVGVATLAGWFIFQGVAKSREIDPKQIASTRQGISTILGALESYREHTKEYPTTEQGLDALVTRPKEEPVPENWKEFLRGKILDAWGNDFVYRPPEDLTGVPELISPGRDGELGTEDDISSKDKN